jgi:hypothetical protein
MPHFIVFQQNPQGSWDQVTEGAVEAVNADAAIEQARSTAGTFVAVLVRGFRPRTLFAPPKPPAAPKQQGGAI